MRKLIVAAAVAVVLVVAGRGHTAGSQTATRPPSTASAPATTRARLTSSAARPTTTRRRPAPPTTARHPAPTVPSTSTSTTRPPATSTTTTAVAPARHSSTTRPTTTTTIGPAQRAALRAVALQTCLESAAADNLKVVSANNAWFQQQLHALPARGKRAVILRNALLVDEQQTRDLIDGQYTIDQSKCYIKYA